MKIKKALIFCLFSWALIVLGVTVSICYKEAKNSDALFITSHYISNYGIYP